MSLFEFILVMVSFVLAIGVTHLLQGSVKIFRHRATLGPVSTPGTRNRWSDDPYHGTV